MCCVGERGWMDLSQEEEVWSCGLLCCGLLPCLFFVCVFVCLSGAVYAALGVLHLMELHEDYLCMANIHWRSGLHPDRLTRTALPPLPSHHTSVIQYHSLPVPPPPPHMCVHACLLPSSSFPAVCTVLLASRLPLPTSRWRSMWMTRRS